MFVRSCYRSRISPIYWRQVPALFIGSTPLVRFQLQFALARAPDGGVKTSNDGSWLDAQIGRSGSGRIELRDSGVGQNRIPITYFIPRSAGFGNLRMYGAGEKSMDKIQNLPVEGIEHTKAEREQSSGMPTPLLVSARTAAAMCEKSLRTWRTWDAAGWIPRPVRIGRSTLWRVEELKDWVTAGCPRREEWEARK